MGWTKQIRTASAQGLWNCSFDSWMHPSKIRVRVTSQCPRRQPLHQSVLAFAFLVLGEWPVGLGGELFET